MSFYWCNKRGNRTHDAHEGRDNFELASGFYTTHTKLKPVIVWNKLKVANKHVVICFCRKITDEISMGEDYDERSGENYTWCEMFKKAMNKKRNPDTTYSILDTSVTGSNARNCYENIKQLHQFKCEDRQTGIGVLCVIRIVHTTTENDNIVEVAWMNFDAKESQESTLRKLESFIAFPTAR
ncbi:hypothetical protein CYMTET_2711 [Cymbomonas tetramitiformis]|uniref:Uncharacterized protein n=1 Tax=Cymbomonas tetramitiformis TaxID=36881 RepID=A0AAE0BZT2_9CHLO|nr:hypothetical protein CYMTET_44613 [Cymbomonas tetramitiformis]KAK3289852.1 hypothetical protein CYMTET_2711 [Cymbomonas tetramitiformis]